MDSFELNKIIGAVLGTLLFVMGVGFLAEAIYHPIEDRGPGYTLPEPEVAEGGGEAEEVVVASIGTLLASADAVEGTGQARKCQSCHTFTEGGANGQGPNLWGVVGRPIASHEGFAYSPELVAHAAVEPTWTYEELNAFILAPRAHVPGTKMNYAGVKNDAERANIIAFLSTLSSDPVPFPAPEAPEDEAAAEGTAPADEDVPAEDQTATPTEDAAPAADEGDLSTETMTAPEPADEGTPVPEISETVPTESSEVEPDETVVEGTPAETSGTETPAAQ